MTPRDVLPLLSSAQDRSCDGLWSIKLEIFPRFRLDVPRAMATSDGAGLLGFGHVSRRAEIDDGAFARNPDRTCAQVPGVGILGGVGRCSMCRLMNRAFARRALADEVGEIVVCEFVIGCGSAIIDIHSRCGLTTIVFWVMYSSGPRNKVPPNHSLGKSRLHFSEFFACSFAVLSKAHCMGNAPMSLVVRSGFHLFHR